MSEQSPSIDQLKKTYEQLAFIHQVLTQRTQYFLQEVDVAKDAAATVTSMANKLADEIKAQETPVQVDESSPVTEEDVK